MGRKLFVSYNHGCRGEWLSQQISYHPTYRTLTAKHVNGRTIITNDHFDKIFLAKPSVSLIDFPNDNERDRPHEDNIVVPSHFFYDSLKEYYPDADFVAIDCPEDVEAYKQFLFDRFYLYRTTDLRELIGLCKATLDMYRPGISEQERKKFISEVLRAKVTEFGEIHCMAKGVEPTLENKYALLDNRPNNWHPLSDEIRKNSLVIKYEDVDKVNINKIVDHFNFLPK